MAKRMPLPPEQPLSTPQGTIVVDRPMPGFAGHFTTPPTREQREAARAKAGPAPLDDELGRVVASGAGAGTQETPQAAGGVVPAFLLKDVSPIKPGVEEVEIPVDLIDPSPYQPRLQIDEEKITELGASLASGQINAIIVRPINGRYELICGERRWRAMQSIGGKTIRAIIRPMSDTEADLEALVDNDAREDLTSFERGVRYKSALDKKLVKNPASLARRVGKNALEISRCLSFFKLPVEVLPLLNQRPGFLSSRAVTDFLPYVEKNDQDLVTVAITKVFDGTEVTAALNWLKAESRARHTPAAPSHIQEYTIDGRNLGSMRVDGRRVVITCAPGVTPDELINTILLSKPESLSNG